MEQSGEVARHHTHHAHFILKGGAKKKGTAGRGKKKAASGEGEEMGVEEEVST